jgi:hypothetical protein
MRQLSLKFHERSDRVYKVHLDLHDYVIIVPKDPFPSRQVTCRFYAVAPPAALFHGPALLIEHPPGQLQLPPRSAGRFAGSMYCVSSVL